MNDIKNYSKGINEPRRPGGVPEPVDIHVGRRVRQRRSMLGMSQEKLGAAIGLTFQQVQKYESGANRISASRLYHISKVLNVQISHFFEGISSTPITTPGKEITPSGGQTANPDDPMAKRETLDLVRSYYKISDPGVRRRVLELTKQLGNSFSVK